MPPRRKSVSSALNKGKEIYFGDLAEVNPPVSCSNLSPDSPVSFIPMADVSDYGQWVTRQVRPYQDVRNGYSVFQEGDILFAKITPCTENGKGCHATGLANGRGFGSTEFHVLRAKPGVDPRIVYHISVARDVRHRAASIMGGSAGQQRVPADFFQMFRLSSSILDNQNTTASLFDALDNAITHTRAVIDQTRRVKTALLDSLVTRGLPRKRTKFRKIRLGEVFQERKERGRPGLPIMAVTMNDGLVERISLDRRMETSLEAESHLLVRKGDIGYNMMRMWQGVFGLAQRDCLISPAYVVVTPLAGIVPEYAAHLFKHPAVIRKFHLFSQGLTDDRLRLYFDQFKTITLQIVADEDEQRKIAAMLQAVDDRINSLVTYCERLSCVKQALGHVLLTGKLQVKTARSQAISKGKMQVSSKGCGKWRKK